MDHNKKTSNTTSGSFRMNCDLQFLLLAELCIVGAASQDSFEDIFEHIETVQGLDEQPERELNNVQIAAVVDSILRRICDGDTFMHKSIIDSLRDMLRSDIT